MESKKTPLTGYFTKISVFCAFAPFFSHKEKWRYLLCCLCKESNAFWKKNQRLLDNLSYIEFADEPEMIEIIKSLFIVNDSVEELCRLNQIFLRFLQNPKGCSEFIKLASDYKLKKLSWFGVSALSAVTDENVIDLERFCFNTLPSKFKKVSLHGCTDVYRFLTFLSIVLQKVSDQVILINFDLNKESLKVIFESCTQAKSIHLNNCCISHIDESFNLSIADNAKIEHLYFAKTICLDSVDLVLSWNNIVGALSKTSLFGTLKKVSFCGKIKTIDVKHLFEYHGFNIEINEV